MKAKPIAFIDSGIGGLPYLSHARSKLPGIPLIYVADNRTFPYGNKTEAEIQAGVVHMVRAILERFDPELFVVACNTATVVALELLRQTFPYDFVGVVPAVKPAGLSSKKRSIGILATERTVQGLYLDRLVSSYAQDCHIVRYAATELIKAIERDPFVENRAVFEQLLEVPREIFLQQNVDTVVLGCTHFLHIHTEFERLFAKHFTVLDSREGVSNQVVRLMDRHASLVNPVPSSDQDPSYVAALASKAKDVFFLTMPAAPIQVELYKKVASYYGLDYQGALGD